MAVFQRGQNVPWHAVSTSRLFFVAEFIWLTCLVPSLALAEMKTLLVALYQRYSTTVSPEFRSLSPTATSRFELVYDDSYPIAEVG